MAKKTCTKARYNNEPHARKRIKQARKRRFNLGVHPDTWEKDAYLCKHCGFWHLTHIREKDYLTRSIKK